METIWQDIRYAIRTLTRSPGFTLIAIFTLALGIGANTAIFTVVNAVLLRPLAFKDPSQIVLVEEKSPFPTITTSYENYVDWRDQSHSFESMQASCPTAMTLTGLGDPQLLTARYATAGFFPLLGIQPIAGRNFSHEEDTASGQPVAIISYGLWQRLGGDFQLGGQVHRAELEIVHRDWSPAAAISIPAARGRIRSLRTMGENSAGRPQLASGNLSRGAAESRRVGGTSAR